MACIGYAAQSTVRKQFLNPQDVFVLHVPRIFTPNKQGWAFKWTILRRRLQNIGIIAVNHGQVHFPFKTSFFHPGKIFEQKLPHAPVIDVLLQNFFGSLAALNGLQVNGKKGCKNIIMAGAIWPGRNIHHNEFVHHVWIRKREFHRHFAAHGMPQDVGFVDPVLLHKIVQIFCHGRVAESIHLRGAPVVAQIDEVYQVMLGPGFGQGLPVVEGAK